MPEAEIGKGEDNPGVTPDEGDGSMATGPAKFVQDGKCPPARSLRPKLVPIPEGVCVQLVCERNSKGKPVWVFEAMSLIEIADPTDENRKFNIYIEGGA